MKTLKCLVVFISFIFSVNVSFAGATGTITTLRYTIAQGVSDTVYFKMTPMPTGVTQWFYVRTGTETIAGCQRKGDSKTFKNIYSTLLAAKAAKHSITVEYCQDSNGYGLVNNFVQLN